LDPPSNYITYLTTGRSAHLASTWSTYRHEQVVLSGMLARFSIPSSEYSQNRGRINIAVGRDDGVQDRLKALARSTTWMARQSLNAGHLPNHVV
jgi:hypothetical protein